MGHDEGRQFLPQDERHIALLDRHDALGRHFLVDDIALAVVRKLGRDGDKDVGREDPVKGRRDGIRHSGAHVGGIRKIAQHVDDAHERAEQPEDRSDRRHGAERAGHLLLVVPRIEYLAAQIVPDHILVQPVHQHLDCHGPGTCR